MKSTQDSWLNVLLAIIGYWPGGFLLRANGRLT